MACWHLAAAYALCVAWLVVICGCGAPEGPDTVEVTGIVTMSGKPVEAANVIFQPLDDGAAVLPSQSGTNADGRFELQTHIGSGKYKPGIVPGKYAVVITKFNTAAISSTLSPPQNVLPKKYANPSTSGLTATVVPGQANSFEFPLEAE
jgi:hypothetical protein